MKRQPSLLAAVLIAGAALQVHAMAPERWQTLPPTPAAPEARVSGIAAVNGIRMYYARYGTGRSVLLLHGGLGNSNYWGNVIPRLVARHFEVIVADSRGHGRSTRSAAKYSYALMADVIVALLDTLDLDRVD